MKRISIIFITAFILLFSLVTSCFASNYQNPLDVFGVDYSYKKYYIFRNENSGVTRVYLFASNNESLMNSLSFTLRNDSNGIPCVFIDFDSTEHIFLFISELQPDNTWGPSGSPLKIFSGFSTIPVRNETPVTFLESTDTIYYSDGTVFFQPPVQEITPTPELGEIMKTAGKQATAEVIQVILIVIMTTVGLTVLLIGLKKGLTVLMSGFRH